MPYAPLSTSIAPPSPPPTPVAGPAPLPSQGAQPPGYQPISKVGLISSAQPATPSAPSSKMVGGYFQGGGYGPALDKDPYSGKPELWYENPKTQSTQLLSDRTDVAFDPTVPQKIDNKVLQNGRMPESVSQKIKAQLPGSSFDELDHIMPLELGGSNDKSNLRLEPGKNPSAKYSPLSNPTATDPIENQLKQDAVSGKISVVDAWKAMAKAKAITLPEQGGPAPVQGKMPTQANSTPEMSAGEKAIMFFPSTMSTLAELQIDPLSLKADPSKAIGDAWNSVKDTVKNEADNIKQAFTAPTTAGKVGAGLSATAGAANVAFSPITMLFSVANDIPVLGTVAKLISLPFEAVGDAGRTDAIPIVNALPISQDAKDKIVGGVGDIIALAGQLALGKASEGITKSLTEKYGPTDAATIVDKAKEMANSNQEGTLPTEQPAAAIPAEQPEAKPAPEPSAPSETPKPLPEETKPAKDVTLGAGFNPGIDKFISEDVKPALSKAKDIAETVKNGLDAAKEAVVNAVEPAKPVEIKSPEAYAGVMRAIHTPEAESIAFDNQKSAIFDSNFSKLEQFFGKFSDKQLDDFNLTRSEASSPEAQALQSEAQARLAPQLQDPALKDAIREASDHVFAYAQSNGLDLDYFKDYFYGAYKDAAKVDRFMEYWKSTERYTKEKTLPTVADATNFGLELRDKNPITNIKREMQAVAQRVGLKNLRDTELASGRDLLVETDKATPEQVRTWSKINDPTFKDTLADPQYARLVNNLLSTNKVTANPFLKGLRQVTFVAQQVKFFGSIFHMQNELRAAVASELGGLVNPKGWADFAKSFRPIDETDPAYKDYVNLGGGHRYSLESQAETQLTQVLNRFSNGNYIGGWLRLPVAALQSKWLPASPGFIHWMFDDFIPKLKFEKFQEDTAKLSDKLGRPLTDAEKLRAIKNNQNFYGEMNERLFGRSGTVTTGLRLVFLSPGYGEGNFRAAARAATGDAKAINFVVNSLTTSLVAGTIGTRLMTGQWPGVPKNANDIRDLFKIKTNMKDGNGDQVEFDMMTYDKDFWSIYGNAATGQPGKIPTDVSSRVSGMVATPFSVLTDLSTIFKGDMVYDYKGDPVYRSTDTLAQKISKFAQFEANGAQPISASTAQSALQRGVSALPAIGESIVGIRPGTSEQVKQNKQAISDLVSLEAEKQRVQIDLDKLAAENLPEAQKQAKQFNDQQKAKLRDILKGQNVPSVQTSKFFIETLRAKAPKQGTTVGGFLNPPK